MVTEWERHEDIIAERFKREEIRGTFKKKFRAKKNEDIIVEKHGEIYEELGSGEFTVSGLLDKDFTDLLVLDRSERTLKKTVKNVYLKDEKRMNIHFEIRFRVFHPDRFSRNLVRNRKRLFMEDMWADILSNLLYKKSLPEIKEHKISEYTKKDLCEKMKERVKNDMEALFDKWGLRLTHFSIDFEIPEEEKAEAKDIKKPEEMVEEGERKIEEVSREEALAKLERERLEREVKMELEKEEMQKDMEEAIEALKLKEIKDEQSILKKAEEKELGVGEKEDLERKLEELKKAKELTEKKFYKKELSEEAFQRMMEDFEKEIIEIETKLKTKKD